MHCIEKSYYDYHSDYFFGITDSGEIVELNRIPETGKPLILPVAPNHLSYELPFMLFFVSLILMFSSFIIGI